MLFRAATATVSAALGLSHSAVRDCGVALQRARLIPVGGRGTAGLPLTPYVVAQMIVTALATESSTRAVALCSRYGALSCVTSATRLPGQESIPGKILGVPQSWAAVNRLAPGHQLRDLITALLVDGMSGALRATAPLLAFVELRASAPLPRVELQLSMPGRDLAMNDCRVGRLLREHAPKALYMTQSVFLDDPVALATQAREAFDGEPSGALERQRVLSLDAFATIGEAMARDA